MILKITLNGCQVINARAVKNQKQGYWFQRLLVNSCSIKIFFVSEFNMLSKVLQGKDE